jgi:hypothetical protein
MARGVHDRVELVETILWFVWIRIILLALMSMSVVCEKKSFYLSHFVIYDFRV